MARKIAQSTLNASTVDILNVIRQNATYAYQSAVPKIEQSTDIPKVGEILYGAPALQNEFLNALITRIALVRVNSAIFYNPYARLKKGVLNYGETVEQIFVALAKVVNFDPEKAEERELKRTIPDVQSAFHAINWRVVYPVTISDTQLRTAFLSEEGVTSLIAEIVDSVYKAAEYDEFLLFKYLLIKSVTRGQLRAIPVNASDYLNNAAIAFRGSSNRLIFLSRENNEAGVLNNTPIERQVIFMDAEFDAKFDVNVLASAFNMDKATYIGSRYLIDSFSEFDNARWGEIRKACDGVEEVTSDELTLMKNVLAIQLDETWFQVYDNQQKFTEKYAASGDYWNYFYHVWKTVSHSPFHNAVVFVQDAQDIVLPNTLTFKIGSVSKDDTASVFTLIESGIGGLVGGSYQFVQTLALTTAGIGVQPYGALLVPSTSDATNVMLELNVSGTTYTASANVTTLKTGDSVVFTEPS